MGCRILPLNLVNVGRQGKEYEGPWNRKTQNQDRQEETDAIWPIISATEDVSIPIRLRL
ncbi:hypothetical protein SCLCIDRAFT_1213364 [Scleroderma citrinum Foug A]|uniref:Uncharacterized protein n=1 Tax=Scleroderma citrinum Foug A TaxID=1036808 RepID=A0A0C2ZRV7_9AGAM|nr:hypothetical protein SCLCIDRAFT_1213364 [Scleroderma citrinum Foug A]